MTIVERILQQLVLLPSFTGLNTRGGIVVVWQGKLSDGVQNTLIDLFVCAFYHIAFSLFYLFGSIT